MTTGDITTVPTVLEAIAEKGLWFEEIVRRPELSAAVYQLPPGADDPQTPHGEEEIYFVLAGAGTISLAGTDRSIGEGDFIDVPAGTEHRFHSVTDTLHLLAVFAPAFGSVEI